MAFTYIDDILFRVRGNNKDRVLVPANSKAFSLADGIELGALVPPGNYPERIGLVARFLDVVLPLR